MNGHFDRWAFEMPIIPYSIFIEIENFFSTTHIIIIIIVMMMIISFFFIFYNGQLTFFTLKRWIQW